MFVKNSIIKVQTNGENDILNLTPKVEQEIRRMNLKNGMGLVFTPGSTGAITTIEYEPGLIKDLPQALERLAPKDLPYNHHLTWNDGNGHSHIRASIIGQDLSFPVIDYKPQLGTWQQIILVECDVRPRNRKVILQVIGEFGDR